MTGPGKSGARGGSGDDAGYNGDSSGQGGCCE